MKNTTLDSKGLENATQVLSSATDQAKKAIIKLEPKPWKNVWGGLVHERNVLFILLAGLLLLGSVFVNGWKISFLIIPIAALMCLVPAFI